ncbi:MAG: VanR-ABDEGLN family response regulator transcription factor [Lachnospiraceae bacterium]|nr:VanR-ABDEGLN family response regulator transcription factor [Lachnospiraceae bacterium]
MKKQILIVDDEKEIADLVEVYLISEGYDVLKYYNGQDALQGIMTKKVDLAILDVMLPDMDGFTLCRKIREHFFFPIIMLTAKVEESDKITGITIGADDYITKPFHSLELIARVKAQLRRVEQYNCARNELDQGEIYYAHGLEVNADTHICRLYDKEILLTPIEFDILLYLCRHMDQVVGSEELFEAVWKEKYMEANNTVFVHIARIREKMGENSRKPKYIKTVWGVGYKIESEA